MRMFVKLSIPESGRFEIAHTVDISCHGARVASRTLWRRNEHLLVQSIRGGLWSRARVAHCQSLTEGSYVIGLEMYSPVGDWTVIGKPSGQP